MCVYVCGGVGVCLCGCAHICACTETGEDTGCPFLSLFAYQKKMSIPPDWRPQVKPDDLSLNSGTRVVERENRFSKVGL